MFQAFLNFDLNEFLCELHHLLFHNINTCLYKSHVDKSPVIISRSLLRKCFNLRIDSENPKDLHAKRQTMVDAAKLQRSKFKDSGYFEDRSCPVCSRSVLTELFLVDDGRYVLCNSCRMIFLNPVLTDEWLEKFYASNHSEQALTHPSERDYYDRIYRRGLENCMSRLNVSSLLDVGCSDGTFLDLARASGIETFGVEYNEKEIALGRSKSHTIWQGSIDLIPDDHRFDVITLWDVFEHVKNGVSFLTSLKKLLNPDGIIFLQIPNSASLAARIMREHCRMFDGMEHVNLYSPATIDLLSKRVNFSILSIESIIDELAPLYNWLSYEDPYNGSFSKPADAAWINSQRIHENLLGYKLQIVLKPN